MTTEPRSLREIVARAIHLLTCDDPASCLYGTMVQDVADSPSALDADAILDAIRTALAANPELIEELGWDYAVLESIVRDLSTRVDIPARAGSGKCWFCGCSFPMHASHCEHQRARAWVTEHPQAPPTQEKREA